MSDQASSSSSSPSSDDIIIVREDDDDDANVLDAFLESLDAVAETARAKLSVAYADAREFTNAQILLLSFALALFSLFLAHFIAARLMTFLGFGSREEKGRSRRRKSKKRDSILLCGQDGAGSTSAYLLLKNKSLGLGTVTSMIENESEVEISSRGDANGGGIKVNVIDIPGHAKIRNRFYDRFLPRAKAIVFFVDGVEFSTNKRDVADHLYNEILIEYDNVRSKRIPILIACNKMDKTESCSPASFVKKRLESEIEIIRTTRDVVLKDAQFDDGSRKARKRAKEIERKRQREVTGLGWKDEWGKFSFDKASEKKTHGRFLFCACSCVGEDQEWKEKKESGGGSSDDDASGNNRNLSAVRAFAVEHGR